MLMAVLRLSLPQLGERLLTRQDVRPYLEAGCIDIIQPDIAHCASSCGSFRVKFNPDWIPPVHFSQPEVSPRLERLPRWPRLTTSDSPLTALSVPSPSLHRSSLLLAPSTLLSGQYALAQDTLGNVIIDAWTCPLSTARCPSLCTTTSETLTF